MFKFFRTVNNDQKGVAMIMMIIVSTLLAGAAYYLSGVSENAVKESNISIQRGEKSDLEKFIINATSCSKTKSRISSEPHFLYSKNDSTIATIPVSYTHLTLPTTPYV